MIHKYLEVEWGTDSSLFIWDNSTFIECVEHNGNFRLAAEYKTGYITIHGTNTTYHIKGFENVEKAQSFAIWYHVNRAKGKIEQCCECCITSKPEPKQSGSKRKRKC